jgi:DNA-binding GntR family transcriptional regulator
MKGAAKVDSTANMGQILKPSAAAGGARQKLTDWAYRELKAAILDLRLAPGQPLRENAIAESLGISKTPVREALAWLERDGLVVTEVFKGAVVSSYSRHDLEELYELRELLEVAAARAAAESLSDVVGQELQRIAADSRREARMGHTRRLAIFVSEFDSVIFENVANSRLRSLIANLRDHLTRVGHLTVDIPGRLEKSVEEHDRIISAIVNRDPELAEATMREHIASVKSDQLAQLEAVDSPLLQED